MSARLLQPCVIPDPLDPQYGPSADNIPIVSSSPGTPVTIASIGNGSSGTCYNIATTFLPQPTGASYVYRITFNGYANVGTVPIAGPITLLIYGVKADTSTYLIGSTTTWLKAAGVFAYFSCSAEFVPSTGDSLRILVLNDTGLTLSNLQLVPTSKGCAIELVSKASTTTLIFS